jgi:K+-sensing histidine kinase KdpD
MEEREILQQELAKTRLAYYRTAEMSKLKAGFLARTAHELRSPLASIISLHQLILNDLCESPAEEKEFLDQAYQAALKLTKLLDLTISVSKLEDGKLEVESKPFFLAELLLKVHQSTSLQAANRNIKLTFPDDYGDWCVVGDSSYLSQVLILSIESAIVRDKAEEIIVTTAVLEGTNEIEIGLQLAYLPDIWSEPVDLWQKKPSGAIIPPQLLSQEVDLSPAMKLLIA